MRRMRSTHIQSLTEAHPSQRASRAALFLILLLTIFPFSCLPFAADRQRTPESPESLPESLIEVIRGEAALLISVPHDGSLDASLPKRESGADFSLDRDVNSALLARDIAASYAGIQGSHPTLIINRLHRIYLDVNRPRSEAATDSDALQIYDLYHQAIQAETRRLKALHGSVLFVDLHAQATYPSDLMTDSDSTRLLALQKIAHRYSVYGISATARADLFEHTCFLPCSLVIAPVPDGFLDGYTAKSVRQSGIQSVQLEVHARQLRNETRRRQLADALARLLVR